jgi:hypothetical protein
MGVRTGGRRRGWHDLVVVEQQPIFLNVGEGKEWLYCRSGESVYEREEKGRERVVGRREGEGAPSREEEVALRAEQ